MNSPEYSYTDFEKPMDAMILGWPVIYKQRRDPVLLDGSPDMSRPPEFLTQCADGEWRWIHQPAFSEKP